MTADMWEQVTRAAHGRAAEYFSLGENQVILDFIQTAKTDVSIIIKELSDKEGETT